MRPRPGRAARARAPLSHRQALALGRGEHPGRRRPCAGQFRGDPVAGCGIGLREQPDDPPVRRGHPRIAASGVGMRTVEQPDRVGCASTARTISSPSTTSDV